MRPPLIVVFYYQSYRNSVFASLLSGTFLGDYNVTITMRNVRETAFEAF